MSKRLQVLMRDSDFLALKRHAANLKLTVGEWVRQTLFKTIKQTSSRSPEEKLREIRRAIQCHFPTSDIDQMLREIEQGYTDPHH